MQPKRVLPGTERVLQRVILWGQLKNPLRVYECTIAAVLLLLIPDVNNSLYLLIHNQLTNPFYRGFYMSPNMFYLEPKRVVPGAKKGSPMGTAEEPYWNPFF